MYNIVMFRYMGEYSENREWYDQDSSLLYDIDPLTSKASLLTKYEKKYFLIHGTGDDNVHFRHSALWEQRLIEAGKLTVKLYMLQTLIVVGLEHDLQFYTDQKHGLDKSRSHLFKRMTHFLDICFAVIPDA